jgi:hypothetical protein
MDWDVIFSYTRKQAIEDGVLIDISELAKEAGFKVPVAITSTLYDGWIKCEIPGQDETGRLWDLLTILRLEAAGSDSDTVIFEVMFQTAEHEWRQKKIKAIIGPGDTPAPVLTIMLPEED